MATAEEYAKMSDAEKKKEDWMNSKWRPMMGWLYMVVCFADFVAFPIMYAVMTALMFKGQLPQGFPSQWNPLTLQGAGLFHLAMGAVLGLAAWGRTQEKLNGANNGGAPTPGMGGMPSTFGAPSSGGFSSPSSFGAPASGSFGGSSFGGASNQGFPQPPAGNFGATAGGFGSAAPIAAAGFGAAAAMAVPFTSNEVLTGPGGKPMPVQPPEPEL